MSVNVENIIQRVTETIKSETVIGEPITVGAVTLIPVINVSFGFGGGGGNSKSGNPDEGNGAGGGARMTVAGMVVVKGDDVNFLPTGRWSGKPGTFDKLLDSLPDLIEKIKGKSSNSKNEPESL